MPPLVLSLTGLYEAKDDLVEVPHNNAPIYDEVWSIFKDGHAKLKKSYMRMYIVKQSCFPFLLKSIYRISSKYSALLIIRHPLPKD